MNAIIPLNLAAVRVSANDLKVTNGMRGRTAIFENMPPLDANTYDSDPASWIASTGDVIDRDPSLQTANDPLQAGIHLHWELPDFFRRGVRQNDESDVKFPAVPNRWLVVRYVDQDNGTPVSSKGFVVESDYVDANRAPKDANGVIRPQVTVPLTPSSDDESPPSFMYLGRIVDYESWPTPPTATGAYLPTCKPAPQSLTSVGFVGPSFAAYYPECQGVFGFWDYFGDLPDIAEIVNGNGSASFRVSYQVIGWFEDPSVDPLSDFDHQAQKRYQALVEACGEQGVPIPKTPAQVAADYAASAYRWRMNPATMESAGSPTDPALPTGTLCAGSLQEIVWQSPPTNGFLGVPGSAPNPSVWQDTDAKVAIGNTTVEALSALLRSELPPPDGGTPLLDNYEYLLNAFQLGLLTDLERDEFSIFDLDEALHSRAFARSSGGLLWVVTKRPDPTSHDQPNPNQEVTLPLDLAESLMILNTAQKAYDQGRAQLEARRRQLFMDWYRFAKIYAWTNASSSNPSPPQWETVGFSDTLGSFLTSSGASELQTVVNAGNLVGLLGFGPPDVDGNAAPVSPTSSGTLAAAVVSAYDAFVGSLAANPASADWEVRAAPAEPFWMPTDPVLVIQGSSLEAARRNGPDEAISVRLSGELLGLLAVDAKNAATIEARNVSGLMSTRPAQPQPEDVAVLLGEMGLITPMLADLVYGAFTDASISRTDFVTALQSAQGGLSPLDPISAPGLFEAVLNEGPMANATETVASPLAASFTFTNDLGNGWTPNPVAWSRQSAYPELSVNRYDPFLPVQMIWSCNLYPLLQNGAGGSGYSPDNLKGVFGLDPDSIDYTYPASASIASSVSLAYTGSVALSKKPAYSLSAQIRSYIDDHDGDQANSALKDAAAYYDGLRVMSQALGGFNRIQTLRNPIPKVQVQNLAFQSQDAYTPLIAQAIIDSAAMGDEWYDSGFNGFAPVSGSLLASNFGPLRAGFASLGGTLEIVDVFGQRMALGPANGGAPPLTPALSMTPMAGMPSATAYLPPRVLAPTRMWFRWLSARHDGSLSADFVEMGERPATSPIFGWVLPNHLDPSLFFFDDDGAAIGSFGLEAGGTIMRYRTRAGNAANPGDDLAKDIGPPNGPSLVNPNLGAFMWYLNDRGAGSGNYLAALLGTIEASDKFLNAPAYAQDAGLAILIGRPLALARAVLGMETSGGTLPLSPADVFQDGPFYQDVTHSRYDYLARQATSSGNLGEVQFPVRLGDLAKAQDGLVAFLAEGDPTLYAPAATGAVAGIEAPAADTLQVTLNASPLSLTLLLDPRASIHATTGVLPVTTLSIPPDLYAQVMRKLAVTFFTHPILERSDRFELPLPAEGGFAWSWVQTATAPALLAAQAPDEAASYGYSPQTLREGWLRLEASEIPPAEPRPIPHSRP